MIRRSVELALIELIIFMLLWFWDSFIAFYFTLALSFVCLAVFIISLIAEWIEPSRINKFYFYAMGISVFVPWVAAGIIALLGLDMSILE
jgi:hypothetical protein